MPGTFTYIFSFISHNLFKARSEKLSNLPRITQQVNGFATGSVWCQPRLLPPHCRDSKQMCLGGCRCQAVSRSTFLRGAQRSAFPRGKRLLKTSQHTLFRKLTSLDRKGHPNLKLLPLFQVFYYIEGRGRNLPTCKTYAEFYSKNV